MRQIVLSVALILLLCGCAHVFSKQADQLVDPSIRIEQLLEKPNEHIGKHVKIGGMITDASIRGEILRLELMHFDLDRNDIPDMESDSAGRFVAETRQIQELARCKPGRLASMIGQITSEAVITRDSRQYRYPVLSIVEMKTWKVIETPTYYSPPYYPFGWYWGTHWHLHGPYYHRR